MVHDASVLLKLSSELLDRIDSARRGNESRTDLIRKAIERELRRREASESAGPVIPRGEIRRVGLGDLSKAKRGF